MPCNSIGICSEGFIRKVQLEFRIRTLLYNTSRADYRCSPGPGHGVCTYRLAFLGRNVAVLSSSHKEVNRTFL